MSPGAISSELDGDLALEQPSGKGLLLSNGHGHGATATEPAPYHPQPPQQHPQGYQELDASRLTYSRVKSARAVPDEAAAWASAESVCTDHMVVASWRAGVGWTAPEMRPYGPLSLMPTASVLHYATECFEGLKAYRGHDGQLRLFRPDCNAARMVTSAVRISLPAFPPRALEQLVVALMAVDGPRWLPRDRPGSFLYLRPALIATNAQLGVQAPRDALLFITASFMPRLDAPAGGMRLHTSPEHTVRAWAGGFGYAKVGANYGPSLLATAEARLRGFHQILWLYGPDGLCTEAGASNFFVVWRCPRTARPQLVTAPLDDRIILDGVTRRSLLHLARERLAAATADADGDGELDALDIVERTYTIDDVLVAHAEGRLIEAFVAGTAYFICPVSLIHHRGKDVPFPMGEHGNGGRYTLRLKSYMTDIMYGVEQHEWGVVVPEEQ